VNRAALLLLLGILSAGSTARAQESQESAPPRPAAPSLTVSLASIPGAALDTPVVRAEHLLDDRVFDGALRNGFPVHYHFRLELWRKAALFDHLARDAEWDAFVRLDPLTGEYDLIRSSGSIEHFTQVAAVSRALASPFHVDLLPPEGSGTHYYYIVTLQIESLSESELEEVERWLKGDVGPAISHSGNIGDALAEGVRRLLIRFSGLPRRTLEARTAAFEAGR
jgi:hypothetical protein